jgi:hypothetical protein
MARRVVHGAAKAMRSHFTELVRQFVAGQSQQDLMEIIEKAKVRGWRPPGFALTDGGRVLMSWGLWQGWIQMTDTDARRVLQTLSSQRTDEAAKPDPNL